MKMIFFAVCHFSIGRGYVKPSLSFIVDATLKNHLIHCRTRAECTLRRS